LSQFKSIHLGFDYIDIVEMRCYFFSFRCDETDRAERV